jgi:hypothetical protein
MLGSILFCCRKLQIGNQLEEQGDSTWLKIKLFTSQNLVPICKSVSVGTQDVTLIAQFFNLIELEITTICVVS